MVKTGGGKKWLKSPALEFRVIYVGWQKPAKPSSHVLGQCGQNPFLFSS